MPNQKCRLRLLQLLPKYSAQACDSIDHRQGLRVPFARGLRVPASADRQPGTCAAPSLNHLVRPPEYRRRDREAEGLAVPCPKLAPNLPHSPDAPRVPSEPHKSDGTGADKVLG